MSRFPDHLMTGKVRADLWTRLLHALLCYRTFGLEWFLAIEATVCGFWILLPGHAFGEATLLYNVPDALLSFPFLLMGITHIWALAKFDVKATRYAALRSFALWSLLTTAFLLTPPRTIIIIPIVFGLAFSSMWVYVRLHLRYGP